MRRNPDDTKLVKTRILPFSREPLLGLMMLETSEGPQRISIDEHTAGDLLDEVLAFFGVPRPPAP